MKTRYFPFLLLLCISTACNGTKTVTSGDLRLDIDSRMHWSVTSLADGAEPLSRTFSPAGTLVADEGIFTDFERSAAERIGDGYAFTGTYERNGIRIEKHQRITPAAGYPGMALIETYYVNQGRPISVKSVRENQLGIEADSLLWSFQPSSTAARADWVLPIEPGFEQNNYLGMNNSDYGGGIPMASLWRRDAGISTGLLEPTLKMVSMPVQWVRGEDHASLSLQRDFRQKRLLETGDTLMLDNSFVAVHTGDFFNPLQQFSTYMQQHEGVVLPEPETEAYEPVWCAWGYERTFTIDEVLGTLPKVAELGFKWVDVDDGFQIAEGDWETNARFPGGDKDMRRLTDAIHARGMKAKLWWAPLAADPGTKVLREHPEMQLLTEEGTPEYITWWDSYYLSPVNPATERYTLDLVDRFLNKWNFDGLKLDGQHLNCCLPDHNPHSGLGSPDDAVEQLPVFFKAIFDRARALKPDAVVQLCPCGCAMNFYNIPYMNQAVASDPTSSWQIRLKGKAYKAMAPQTAYYADHVELSDGGNDFPTQIGIGGVLGTKFTWPKNNPDVKGDYLLTPEKEQQLKKWLQIYNDKMLSTGEYLNLYDLGWDRPETHVISKQGRIYYAFYADEWQGGAITLRGLEPGRRYTVCEYAAEGRTFALDGGNPVITPVFKGSYLIEVF